MDKRDLLLNYNQYSPSKSCYLDGRYFNLVFQDYPGLIETPLYIHIDEGELNIMLPYMKIDSSADYFGLLRVVVTTPNIRHSLVVIFDHENQKAYIYNPDVHHPEFNDLLVDGITAYLSKFLDYEYFSTAEFKYVEKEQLKCEKNGVCNALTIMYALFFIEGLEYTNRAVNDARKFMTAVETNYDLPEGKPDVEYLSSEQALGIGLGTLGGAALGSTLGPAGLVIGGLAGAGVGYGIGSLASPRYSQGYYPEYSRGYGPGYSRGYYY